MYTIIPSLFALLRCLWNFAFVRWALNLQNEKSSNEIRKWRFNRRVYSIIQILDTTGQESSYWRKVKKFHRYKGCRGKNYVNVEENFYSGSFWNWKRFMKYMLPNISLVDFSLNFLTFFGIFVLLLVNRSMNRWTQYVK